MFHMGRGSFLRAERRSLLLLLPKHCAFDAGLRRATCNVPLYLGTHTSPHQSQNASIVFILQFSRFAQSVANVIGSHSRFFSIDHGTPI